MISKLLEPFAKKIARRKHKRNVAEFIRKHKEVKCKPFPGEPKIVLNESRTLTIVITIVFMLIGVVFTFNRDFRLLGVFFMFMSALMSWGIFFPPRIVFSGDNIFYRNSLFMSIILGIKRANNLSYASVKFVQFTISKFNDAPFVYVIFVVGETTHMACFTNFDKCLILSSFFPKNKQAIENEYN
ncbi:hypothetical protein [Candidatus Uabimicrobium sp. HlEnr_7]|uniref:hypothetical protein n=1 Tax=Candidatus Uabimicrobium helgolandensis TaxID=3095367 RepID=UPI00355616E6